MLVVGSRALISHGVKIGRRPSDTDFIATPEEHMKWLESFDGIIRCILDKPNKRAYRDASGGIYEFEIARPGSTSEWLLENYETLGYNRGGDCEFAHPDVILTLKLSHRYLKNNPFFRKTMDDILALRGLKFRVPPQLQAWLKLREKETYNYGHPSLKQGKANFFSGDGVNYVYEHDDIHVALATLPEPIAPHKREPDAPCNWPAYTYFQKDPRLDVSVSKEKWDALKPDHGGDRVQLLSILEESYVLALERSQIPCDFSIAPRTSFLIALEKVCTSITSGWWREYAWEHYYQVLGMYSDDYVDRFQKALADGKIRLYQGKAA
jgi:hypothetical protein